MLNLPSAPSTIEKGVPLKVLLDKDAVDQLAHNLHHVHPDFDKKGFISACMKDLEPLALKERSIKFGRLMKEFLPPVYSEAIAVILKSMTPPLEKTEDNGLAVMFYMPHMSYIHEFGQDQEYNGGDDPFDISMTAQYELTQRFTAEFSIRPFLIDQQDRTFDVLYKWMKDPSPHVRRLTSEGTRTRLPWAERLPDLIKDPTPSIKILEELKNDKVLYVRRSVANHVGDIAKDHLDLALDLCRNWLPGASKELKWVIRHALRHPAKKNVEEALKIRVDAK